MAVDITQYIPGTQVRYSDLSFSSTAAKRCIQNDPSDNDKVIKELEKTAQLIIQPCIDRFGEIYISSGYRGPQLNKAVGGAAASQHCLGQAADFWIVGKKNMFRTV